MSGEDPYDWGAGLFAVLCFVFCVWWVANGGEFWVAGGAALLMLVGAMMWWWGR